PTGQLDIHADSITVELDASIVVAPTGDHPAGRGGDGRVLVCSGSTLYSGGAGGSYGTRANNTPCSAAIAQPVYGYDNDAVVEKGSAGGAGYQGSAGGKGGGVLRLFAASIDVAGQITAN